MESTCRITGQRFTIDETERFLLRRLPELNPVLGAALPAPTIHPFEILRRMYAFGGLRTLYRAKSAISGQPQLTRYDPSLGTKICTYDEFYTDAVENTEHGRPYDFSRPFFDQWRDLLDAVVLPPLNRRNCEESDYVNGAEDLKRCYLCFWARRCVDCLYCLFVNACTDCIDCAYSKSCELCYSSRDLTRCYEVENSADCVDSRNLFGCYDCRSCEYCYGCFGLYRAKYHIFNQPVARDAYEKFISEKNLSAHSCREAAAEECARFNKGAPRANTLVDCSDASGAYLVKCENVSFCYNGVSTRNSGYLISSDTAEYCYKGLATNAQFCYTAHTLGSNVAAYCYSVFGGEGNIYSAFLLQNCSHCFGSIALRGKSYCVLNKQYTREEYESLVPRIIAHMRTSGEWGEWFPPGIAPHSYEESSIHEVLTPIPLSVAKERGYRMSTHPPESKDQQALRASDLPDTLNASDASSLAGKPIACEQSGKVFNLQQRELDRYLRLKLPLPRRHWNVRMQGFINDRELIPAV